MGELVQFRAKTGPVPWPQIAAIDVSVLLANGADGTYANLLDALIEPLISCNVGNPLRRDLLKLFRVTQLALEFKTHEANQLEAELEELHDKTQDQQLQQPGFSTSAFSASEQVRALQRQVDELQAQLRTRDGDVEIEKRENERLQSQVASQGKLLQDLDQEHQRCTNELEEARMRIQEQESLINSLQEEQSKQRQAISGRLRSVATHLDEADSLRKRTSELEKQVTDLQRRLETATQEMYSATETIERLTLQAQDKDDQLQAAEQHGAMLEGRVQDLEAQIRERILSDDNVVAEIDHAVAEWKHLLVAKDAELLRAKQTIAELESQGDPARASPYRHDGPATARSRSSVVSSAFGHGARGSTAMENDDRRLDKLQEQNTRLEQELEEKDQMIQELRKQSRARGAVVGANRFETQSNDQVAKLTAQVNQANHHIDLLLDDNDALRELLSLGANDLPELRPYIEKRRRETETLKASNELLQRRVRELEDARNDLRVRLAEAETTATNRGDVSHSHELHRDDIELQGRVAALESDKQDLRDKVSEQDHMIGALQRALRQVSEALLSIHSQISETTGGVSQVAVDCPEVSRLLQVLDTKTSGARFGVQQNQWSATTSPTLPASLERAWSALEQELGQLRSINQLLQQSLSSSQQEQQRSARHQERLKSRIEQLESELATAKTNLEAVKGQISPLQLPAGMHPSALDAVASANEQLMQVLHSHEELKNRSSDLAKRAESVERALAVAVAEKATLYEDVAAAKRNWTAEREKLVAELADAEARAAVADRLRAEMDQVKQAASIAERGGGSQIQQELVSVSATLASVRAIEAGLRVSYRHIVNENEQLRRHVTVLRSEAAEVQGASVARVAVLERRATSLKQKLEQAQAQLATAVDQEDYRQVSMRAESLAMRHRALLAKHAHLQEQALQTSQLRCNLLEEQMRSRQQEAEIARLHLQLERMGPSHIVTAGDAESLDALRWQVESEKQKSKLLANEVDSLRKLTTTLENRSHELESQIDKQTQALVEARERVSQLEDEAENARANPSSTGNDRDPHLIELENEVLQLKTSLEIAQFQQQASQRVAKVKTKECDALRSQLVEARLCCSDGDTAAGEDAAGKGNPAGRALQLSVENTDLLFKVEQLEATNRRLQTQLSEAEHRAIQEELSHASRFEAWHQQVSRLKTRINALHTQYRGAVPLAQHEAMAKRLEKILERSEELQKALHDANEARMQALNQLDLAKEQRLQMEELVASLRDTRTGQAERLQQWSSRCSELRLENTDLKRRLAYVESDVSRVVKELGAAEERIRAVESESLDVARNHERQQLAWEESNLQLERELVDCKRRLAAFERRQQAVLMESELSNLLPSMDLPLNEQLTACIELVSTLFNAEKQRDVAAHAAGEQLENLKLEVQKLQTQLREKDAQLARHGVTAAQAGAALDTDAAFEDTSASHDDALAAARETIQSLQTLLDMKDQNIDRQSNVIRRLEMELDAEREKSQDMRASTLRSRTEILRQSMASKAVPQSQGSSVQQPKQNQSKIVTGLLNQVQELEDQLAEANQHERDLLARLSEEQQRISVLQDQCEEARLENTRAKARLEEAFVQLNEARQEAEETLNTLQQATAQHTKQLESLQIELDQTKEANDALRKRPTQAQLETANSEIEKAKAEAEKFRSMLARARATSAAKAQDHIPQNQSRVQQTEEEASYLSQQVQQLRRQRKEADTALAKKDENIQKLQEELRKRSSQITQLKTKLASARRTEARSAATTQSSEKATTDQQDRTKSDKSATKGTFEGWAQQKRLQKRLDTAKAALEEKDGRLAEITKQLQDTKQILAKRDRQCQLLSDKLNAANKTLQQKGDSTQHQQPLARHRPETKDNVAKLQRKVQHLQDENTKLKQRSLRLERQGQAAQEVEQATQQQLATAQAEIASYRAKIDQLQTHVKNLERELQQTQQRLSDIEQATGKHSKETVDSLERTVQQLQAENDELREELEAFDPEFFSEIERMRHRLEVEAAENARLRQLVEDRA